MWKTHGENHLEHYLHMTWWFLHIYDSFHEGNLKQKQTKISQKKQVPKGLRLWKITHKTWDLTRRFKHMFWERHQKQ